MKTIATTLFLLTQIYAYSQSFRLDSTFNNSGIVMVDFELGFDALAKTIIQPDGKIVGVGRATDRVCLIRLNEGGTFDESFGSGGKIIIDIPGFWEYATDVEFQNDGKLLIAGHIHKEWTPLGAADKVLLIRLNFDGGYDNSFGNNGIVITDFPNTVEGEPRVEILPDMSFIVLCRIGLPVSAPEFGLIKYLPSGAIDTTFGTQGLVMTDVSEFNDSPQELLIQPDGKILAAGTLIDGFPEDYELVRYLPNGNLDEDFGENGIVITDLADGESTSNLALLPDGKIVLGGTANWDLTILRYHPDGKLDSDFGINGVVVSEITNKQRGGNITLVGQNIFQTATLEALDNHNKHIILGFSSDGAVNTFFAEEGVLNFDNPGYFYESGIEPALFQNDGKMIIGAYATDSIPQAIINGNTIYYSPDIFLIRFTNDTISTSSAETILNGFEPKVFPNPTSGKLFFDEQCNPILDCIETIEICTMNGIQIYSKKIAPNEATIYLPDQLVNGIYILKMVSSSGLFSRKIHIQR